MEMNHIVRVTNLIKTFEGKPAVDGVSFTLFEGENLVLLGKSGSGKTVIMKCIVRLLEPDSGTIEVFGKEIDKPFSQFIGRFTA